MIKLKNNISIPQIGLGVFKIESGAQMNDVIKYAYKLDIDYLILLKCIIMKMH